MKDHVELRSGAYADSVTLLQVSRTVQAADGVVTAQVAMATGLNLEVLEGMGFRAHSNLRQPAQVNPTVRLRDRFVFDQQFEIAKFGVGRGVGPVTVIDQFAVFDSPVIREVVPHLPQRRVAFLADEFIDRMWIQSVPASQILAVEEEAKAFGRNWFRGRCAA